MGTFTVVIQVGDLAGQQFIEVEALVDTGASDTMLPQSILQQLGITPVDRFSYRLADETIVEYDVGEARLRIDGKERTTQVIFGPEGAGPLLGATTLQLFHLGVDPLQEQLVPVTGLLKPIKLEGQGISEAHLEAKEQVQIVSECKEKEEMWTQVESSLKSSGWSVDHPEEPKPDFYVATREGEHRIFWAKYSKYHDRKDTYWLSLEMTYLDGLRDDKGGVLLMLPGVDFALIPFAEALDILDSTTRTKRNEVRLDIRVTGNALLLRPGGTGEWQDVTRYKLDLISL